MALGAIVYRIGTVKHRRPRRHRPRMPLTMAAFVIAGLGLIGVPGTAGFVSKWYLAVGAIEQGWWPLAFLIVASSLIAVVYIGRVVEVAWFREPSPMAAKASDPPLSMLVPLLVLAGATICFGIDTDAPAGHRPQGRRMPARGAQMMLPLSPRPCCCWRSSVPFAARC